MDAERREIEIRSGPGTKKSQTTKLEAVADAAIREIGDRVNADGSKTQWQWTAKLDGSYPVQGDPDRDMVALKKMDDNTIEVTNKKDGKVAQTR